MGIESYGLIGIFASLIAIFGLLDMGLSTTLNRELARLSVLPDKVQEMKDLVRTLEFVYWGVAILIAGIVILLSSPIANYWINADELPVTTVHQALMIMGGIVAFRWPLSLYQGGLMGLQRQVLLNIILVTAAFIQGVGAVLILWLVSPTIQAFLIWQIVASFFTTLYTALYLWKSLPPTDDSPSFQIQLLVGVWRFAAGMTGISITVLFLTQTDKILLSKLLPLSVFGYYSLATVVAATLYKFIGPIYIAVFPRFSELVSRRDEKGLKNLYHKSCQLMSVTILPPAIIVAVFASEIMLLWTGDPVTVANTHIIVSILIIGTALNGLMNLPYALQLAYGWTQLALYINIIAIIVLIPLIFILVNIYGAVGAAVAWVILNCGYVLISIQIMHTRLLKGEQWRWYLNDVAKPLLITLAVVLLWRLVIPVEMSRLEISFYLTIISITTLVSAMFAVPYTRLTMYRFVQGFIFPWKKNTP